MIKDPIEDFVDGLKKMALDLNKNLELVKAWMSIQNTHNEIFLEDIYDLKVKIKDLNNKMDQKFKESNE